MRSAMSIPDCAQLVSTPAPRSGWSAGLFYIVQLRPGTNLLSVSSFTPESPHAACAKALGGSSTHFANTPHLQVGALDCSTMAWNGRFEPINLLRLLCKPLSGQPAPFSHCSSSAAPRAGSPHRACSATDRSAAAVPSPQCQCGAFGYPLRQSDSRTTD